MLGSILQHSMAPTYSMPVKQPLKDAIEARKDILKTLPEVPSDITEDLRLYLCCKLANPHHSSRRYFWLASQPVGHRWWWFTMDI